MKRRALSWFMAAALGVGTMAGGIGSANIVLAEEQKEETEAADEKTSGYGETAFRKIPYFRSDGTAGTG